VLGKNLVASSLSMSSGYKLLKQACEGEEPLIEEGGSNWRTICDVMNHIREGGQQINIYRGIVPCVGM